MSVDDMHFCHGVGLQIFMHSKEKCVSEVATLEERWDIRLACCKLEVMYSSET
jgi:hypothetical protein